MRRFVEGADRGQNTLFPECLEDWIGEDNPVRVIDVFVDELELAELGFDGVEPEVTGRPSYHPSALLKLYIYGLPSRLLGVFVLATLSLATAAEAQPYGPSQGGGGMMGGDWGWGMGYGMGGFGGIGVLVLALVVLGIAVVTVRRRNT